MLNVASTTAGTSQIGSASRSSCHTSGGDTSRSTQASRAIVIRIPIRVFHRCPRIRRSVTHQARARRTRSCISRTARSIPTNKDLLITECPMLSSSHVSMAATGPTFSYVNPCPACTDRSSVMGELRHLAQTLELCGPFGGPGRIRILARVQLDRVGPQLRRNAHHIRVGIDEQGRPDPGSPESGDRLRCPVTSGALQSESSLRGDLFPLLRHERHGRRSPLERPIDHRLERGDLQIHPGADRLQQQIDIPILNMPSVIPQVDGDPIRTTELGEYGGADRIGLVGLPRLPHGGDVINIDEQPHVYLPFIRIPSNGRIGGVYRPDGGTRDPLRPVYRIRTVSALLLPGPDLRSVART